MVVGSTTTGWGGHGGEPRVVVTGRKVGDDSGRSRGSQVEETSGILFTPVSHLWYKKFSF